MYKTIIRRRQRLIHLETTGEQSGLAGAQQIIQLYFNTSYFTIFARDLLLKVIDTKAFVILERTSKEQDFPNDLHYGAL